MDGSNREKIFDYEGSGNVIWSDDKNIYYTEDPEAGFYTCSYFRSVKKYDLSTKTSGTIVSATDSSTQETGCANTFYYDGFILCGGSDEGLEPEGGKVYRYNINEDKLETLDIKTNDKIVDFGKALEQCEYEPYSLWTPHGVVVLEEFYYSGYTAEKISLINGTDKKVLAVEQGKDTFTFLGCGENIAVFADKSHFNAAYSVYSVLSFGIRQSGHG